MTLPHGIYFQSVRPHHYWPGGIPNSVKFQLETQIPTEQLIEDCKAWILFLTENWVTPEAAGVTDDPSDYEIQQRRALIVRWAEAEQSFRDSYHDRAPTRDPNLQPHDPANPLETRDNSDQWHLPNYSLIVLPRVDQTNPANHVQWIKQLLLMNRFDGFQENFLVGDDPNHYLILAGDSADAQSDAYPYNPPTNKEDVARWAYLENADFTEICMTRNGQAVFTGYGAYHFMIDQRNLDDGTMSVVQYGHNGKLKDEVRFRPFWVREVAHVLCETSFEQRDQGSFGWYDMGLPRNAHKHVDMSGTVLAMLESAKVLEPRRFRSPHLSDDVEDYAPGYLELEAEGREAEYDEAPLIEAAFSTLC